MKIIHITASYKPAYLYGGPIQSIGRLCEAMEWYNRQGSKNENIKHLEVLTTTANGISELDVETGKKQLVDGVQVTYFKRLTKDHTHFSPALLWQLRKMIREARHDSLILHIHAWWNLVSVLSCMLAKWHKVPVILSPRGMVTAYTQHNRNSFVKKVIHNTIGKYLLAYCNVHATSTQEKEDILKMIQPKKIMVIPNLVSSEYQVESRKESGGYLGGRHIHSGEQIEGIFKLIFLSRIEEKKGLELLFEALALLDIKWLLTIAGSGTERYVKSLKLKAENLKINNKINWAGQIDNESKFRLIATHDLFVLTSYNENFANVVIESLGEGIPVLVSDKVGLADYVVQKDLGWVCCLAREDIKAKIESAYQAADKRKYITSNAPQIIRNDFNDEVLLRQYLALYNDL